MKTVYYEKKLKYKIKLFINLYVYTKYSIKILAFVNMLVLKKKDGLSETQSLVLVYVTTGS